MIPHSHSPSRPWLIAPIITTHPPPTTHHPPIPPTPPLRCCRPLLVCGLRINSRRHIIAWSCVAVATGYLPGRSDDAVRNRWNRLQEALKEDAQVVANDRGGHSLVKAGYKCSKCGQPKRNHTCTFMDGEEKEVVRSKPASSAPQRHSWTRQVSAVAPEVRATCLPSPSCRRTIWSV